ncbi:S1 RNA-binding domain-containing protein [Alkalicoccus urumqiensis]|nr:S1 RNA-binding domain-containing protein [Alkalicoccus urumqiensis]
MTIKTGRTYTGTVTGTAKFGLFVELPDGRDGLVHISEAAEGFVRSVRQAASKGDTVRVRVLSDDGERISLSMRQASPAPPERTPEEVESHAYETAARAEEKLEALTVRLEEQENRLRLYQPDAVQTKE